MLYLSLKIIILMHGLGHLTCSGIDTLPQFPAASTIFSSSRFVVKGVFRKSGVVHSFKMVDQLLFVFVSHVLYCRELQLFSHHFASYFVQSCVSFDTSQKAHLCSFQLNYVSFRGYPCFAPVQQCWSGYDCVKLHLGVCTGFLLIFSNSTAYSLEYVYFTSTRRLRWSSG